MSKVPVVIVMGVAALVAALWAGLRIMPRPFGLPVAPGPEPVKVEIPAGLPPPVERFYRASFGEKIPVVDTVVMTGRGRIRPFGVWLPARYVFVHRAGRAYRHYFEVTFFGFPFMRVNEGIVDGKSFMEGPMGTYHDDTNTNQGANLALWAEATLFPSIFITDPRVRWTAVDEAAALLTVPCGSVPETFVVRFDPATGLIDMMEAMRYRDPGEGKAKILWITRNEAPDTLPGLKPAWIGSATWLDQGKPWAMLGIEKIALNADVGEYVVKRGY